MNKLFGSFSELETLELKDPAMKRQIFSGENVMLVKNVIAAHEVIPTHHHIHEQMTYILEGTCDIIINGDQVQHGEPGSVAWIPSNADHQVVVTGDKDLVCFDIFSPVREDFIEALKN